MALPVSRPELPEAPHRVQTADLPPDHGDTLPRVAHAGVGFSQDLRPPLGARALDQRQQPPRACCLLCARHELGFELPDGSMRLVDRRAR
jgi:hypothetical protein